MSTSAASTTNAAEYHSARRVRAERRGTDKRYTRRIWGLTVCTCNGIVKVAPSGTQSGGRVGQTPPGAAARARESRWLCLPLWTGGAAHSLPGGTAERRPPCQKTTAPTGGP